MKRFFFILLIVWLAAAAEARPWVLLFGSLNCDECAALKNYWIQTYRAESDPVLVFVNIDKNSNYRFLNRIEDELEIMATGSTFPVIMMGREMVNGVDGFRTLEPRLHELVKDSPQEMLLSGVQKAADEAENSGLVSYDFDPTVLQARLKPSESKTDSSSAAVAVSQDKQNNQTDAPSVENRVPRLLFFKLQGCEKCSRQKKEFDLLKEMLPSLELTEYDVATVEGQAMMSRTRRFFQLEETEDKNLAPMVVWAEGYMTGTLAEAEKLSEKLGKPLTGDEYWLRPLSEDELTAEKSRLQRVIGSLTTGMICYSGLLDGINPCAFATSVFLISYLLYLKKRRREILLIGGCFCIGVLGAYFMYGLALSYLIQFLQKWLWLKIILYGGFSLCGFVFCILHLRDAIRYRRSGKASDMDMGLSKETHRGIHEKIKAMTSLHSWLLIPGAVVLGAVVSSMELACTGQVYFPVLTAVMKSGVTKRALSLLFYYNLCFIMPLAVITVLAAYGIGAKSLADWAKRHVFISKILMSLLFFMLGIVMLWMLFN